MTRYELLGSEGGLQHVTLIAFRDPWSIYFTVKTPWIRDRGWRLRVEVGQRWHLRLLSFTRRRCDGCCAVVWNDVDRCGSCGLAIA